VAHCHESGGTLGWRAADCNGIVETMSAAQFDTLTYAKRLHEAGFTERQAEAQAEALRAVVDENLATKRDLKELENRLEIRFKELDGRIKEMETRLEVRIKEVETKLEVRIKEVETRLEVRIKELDLRIETAHNSIDLKIENARKDVIMKVGGMVVAAVTILLAALGVVAAIVK
jgi:hypothetical protein